MWIESLRTSYYQCRYPVMQYLLREFTTIKEEDYNEELIQEGLPLMFDMLRVSKVECTFIQFKIKMHPKNIWLFFLFLLTIFHMNLLHLSGLEAIWQY